MGLEGKDRPARIVPSLHEGKDRPFMGKNNDIKLVNGFSPYYSASSLLERKDRRNRNEVNHFWGFFASYCLLI